MKLSNTEFANFMKCFLMILVLLLMANFTFAQETRWVGVYTFNEESWDEDQVRTSQWFRLEVKEMDGKLIGIYSEGFNGNTTQRFQLSVKTEGKRAQFYYEQRLPRVEGVEEECGESEFVGSELLFEFEESAGDGEQSVIHTFWQKMNLSVRTETGSSRGNNVFFRKAFVKRCPEIDETLFAKRISAKVKSAKNYQIRMVFAFRVIL